MIEPIAIASLTLSGCLTGMALGQATGINSTTPISLALVVGLTAGSAGVGVTLYSIRRDIRVIKRQLSRLECVRRRLGKVDCGEDLEEVADLEEEPAKK